MVNSIYVLTSKSTHHMGRLGGTASWSLNPSRASTMGWVVCFGLKPHGTGSDHLPFLIGEVGPISVSPEWDTSTQKNKRYLIQFERVAVLPDDMQLRCKSWREIAAGRNPVKYGSLTAPFENLVDTAVSDEDFLASLDFISLKDWRARLGVEPTPPLQLATASDFPEALSSLASEAKLDHNIHRNPVAELNEQHPTGISVDEAKRLLARRHGVLPDHIEIKITF